MAAFMARFMGDERGASIIEYAFILAMVTLVLVGALQFFSGKLTDTLNDIGEHLPA